MKTLNLLFLLGDGTFGRKKKRFLKKSFAYLHECTGDFLLHHKFSSQYSVCCEAENLVQVYLSQQPCWSWLRYIFPSIQFLGGKIKRDKTKMTQQEFNLITIIRHCLLFTLIQFLFQFPSSSYQRIKIEAYSITFAKLLCIQETLICYSF